jgi:hypothetical protein
MSRIGDQSVTLTSNRDRQRRADAESAIRLSDVDAKSLAMQGCDAIVEPAMTGQGTSSGQWQEEIRQRKEQALHSFKASLLDRETDAYLKGADTAVDRESKRAYNTRNIVLLLVVLAVVLMPIVAIIAGLSPQDLGSFIAPVTGIAGTVVGYWFGERGRTGTGG